MLSVSYTNINQETSRDSGCYSASERACPRGRHDSSSMLYNRCSRLMVIPLSGAPQSGRLPPSSRHSWCVRYSRTLPSCGLQGHASAWTVVRQASHAPCMYLPRHPISCLPCLSCAILLILSYLQSVVSKQSLSAHCLLLCYMIWTRDMHYINVY